MLSWNYQDWANLRSGWIDTFCRQETAVECLSALEVHSSSKSVYLPKVFKWFAADLGEDNQLLLKLCAKFVSKELATKIRALADDTDVKLKYMKYFFFS